MYRLILVTMIIDTPIRKEKKDLKIRKLKEQLIISKPLLIIVLNLEMHSALFAV